MCATGLQPFGPAMKCPFPRVDVLIAGGAPCNTACKLRARQAVQLSFRATPSLQREIFLPTDMCHTVARSAVTNMPSDDRVACGSVGSL